MFDKIFNKKKIRTFNEKVMKIFNSSKSKEIANTKERNAFVKRMEKFLRTNNIDGTAYSYGFATENPTLATSKLKKLGIKFKLDKEHKYYTKVIISKTEI